MGFRVTVPSAPTFSATGGNNYRLGIGLVQGNFDTSAGSGADSLQKLANNFGGLGSPAFQKVIAGLYSQMTNGYTANYSYAFDAVANAINQAGQSGLTLADALKINGATGKSGTWSSFSSSGGSPRGGSSGGGGGGGINISLGGGGYAGTSDMSASAEMSAYSSVLSALGQWNLDSLTGKAWDMISNPGFHMNAGEVLDALRKSPEYQAAFPGMAEIRAKGLSMTETQYIGREMDIQDQFAQNGIPQKMLDKTELGKLVANGIYGKNLEARIQKGYEAVKNADPQVKKLLQQWYGVRPGHLLGYMLSPKHGMNQIVKDTQAAMIGTEAHLAGFQGLDRHSAQELSKQMTSSGYGMDYFRTGFAKAAGMQPLEAEQLGQRGEAIATKGQILSDVFTGLNQGKGTTPAQNQQSIQLC
jgi:uncharacterized protein YukE